jgi:hypothetical protein
MADHRILSPPQCPQAKKTTVCPWFSVEEVFVEGGVLG